MQAIILVRMKYRIKVTAISACLKCKGSSLDFSNIQCVSPHESELVIFPFSYIIIAPLAIKNHYQTA